MTAVFGIDALVLVAFALLIAGVVGSVLPATPAGLFSLGGIGLYWWHSNYAEPGTALLLALVLLGVMTTLADVLTTVAAGRLGGASTRSGIAAGVVGLVALLFTGPLGMLAAMGVTVFILEYRRGEGVRDGLVAAVSAVTGAVASAGVQFLLTSGILLVMVLVAIL